MKRIKTSAGELYIGSKDDAFDLIQKGRRFDLIWNLAAELQFMVKDEREIANVIEGNIKDMDIPRDTELFMKQANLVLYRLKQGESVFIHCLGGRGRTGMVLSIIISHLNNYSPGQALRIAKEKCNGPETNEQTAFVHTFLEAK